MYLVLSEITWLIGVNGGVKTEVRRKKLGLIGSRLITLKLLSHSATVESYRAL